MGKQSKPRKPESFGKGKVTPIQIAFIVDRYLSDNNYTETRSIFRNEASSLIANSPINQVPKSLMSLGEMLDEYICLKEQKVAVDRERGFLEQEKDRVQSLLLGMQNVMNAYNAGRSLPAPNAPAAPMVKPAVVPQPNNFGSEQNSGDLKVSTIKETVELSSGGYPNVYKPTFRVKVQLKGVPTTTTMQNTSIIHSLPQSINTNAETGNFSTPMMNVSDRKRKDTKPVDAPSAAKKCRGRYSSRKVPVQGQNTLAQSANAVDNQVVAQHSSTTQPSPQNCIPSGSQVQGSSVVKCLFNQPSLPIPTNSPVPKTPTKTISSHNDTYISPPEISPVATCNGEVTPTCYSVISTKRVMVSPAKQMAYIERSQCISVKTDSDKASKRDHVRSRLDFDASDMPERLDESLSIEISTSECEKNVDSFDIDFPDLDSLGIDFSFTEMLSELELPCEGIDFSYQPASHSKDNDSGSSHECKPNPVITELSTAEVLSEKDMNVQGPNCLNAMKSVTKCITISSPVNSRQRFLDQENF